MDFHLSSYENLLKDFIEHSYEIKKVSDYSQNQKGKVVYLRHDVDRNPNRSLKMAILEKQLNVNSTYYFRMIKKVFNTDIIKSISKLNHEIGYHYENLSKCNGNYKDAIVDFENNLEKLRKTYPVKTIAMHGSPLSKWNNGLLWEKYNYKKYGLINEPYFDINFNIVFYLTDAGRSWVNSINNYRDKVKSKFNVSIKNTPDLLKLLDKRELPNIILLNVHPEHWSDSSWELGWISLNRLFRNSIKKIVLSIKNKTA